MAYQEDSDYQLVDMLTKNYKKFLDFIRKPPLHCDLDPYWAECFNPIDIISVIPENHWPDSARRSILIRGECHEHGRIYMYRAVIKRDSVLDD